jgi:long-chain acyl-CoA synthetase
MEGTATMAGTGGRAVDASTLAEALRRTAATNPEVVAVRTPDESTSLTWAQLLERSDALAGGLAGLGVQRGETVALMLSNRPEFHVCDLAAVTLGATPFSIYLTYPPEQIAYLIKDAAARVAIVEQEHLPAILKARELADALEHVIVVDGDAPEGTLALAEVEASGAGFDAGAAIAAIAPEDIVTLIYTSGTTGRVERFSLFFGKPLVSVRAGGSSNPRSESSCTGSWAWSRSPRRSSPSPPSTRSGRWR